MTKKYNLKNITIIYSIFLLFFNLIITLGLFVTNIVVFIKDKEMVPFVIINIVNIYFCWNVFHFYKCFLNIKKNLLNEKKNVSRLQLHNFAIFGINTLVGGLSLIILLYTIIILHLFSGLTLTFFLVFVYNMLYVVGTFLINTELEKKKEALKD